MADQREIGLLLRRFVIVPLVVASGRVANRLGGGPRASPESGRCGRRRELTKLDFDLGHARFLPTGEEEVAQPLEKLDRRVLPIVAEELIHPAAPHRALLGKAGQEAGQDSERALEVTLRRRGCDRAACTLPCEYAISLGRRQPCEFRERLLILRCDLDNPLPGSDCVVQVTGRGEEAGRPLEAVASARGVTGEFM